MSILTIESIIKSYELFGQFHGLLNIVILWFSKNYINFTRQRIG